MATNDFLAIEEPLHDPGAPRVSILPVPYERTTSYGSGTAAGPAAILEASAQVEQYDELTGYDLTRLDLETLAPLDELPEDPVEALAAIEAAARTPMEAGRFVVTLGGEHALTTAPVRAAREVFGEIGVVQLDAHADLRETYEGTPWSHACVMRRIVELGLPTLAVGIRALSAPEAELVRERDLATVWGHELATFTPRDLEDRLAALPDRVYLTFDVDYFDPSLLPSTGTPEPGGGLWYPTLDLLRTLFRTRTVVAMDAVELAPVPGQPASDFTTARLIAKCLAFLAT